MGIVYIRMRDSTTSKLGRAVDELYHGNIREMWIGPDRESESTLEYEMCRYKNPIIRMLH